MQSGVSRAQVLGLLALLVLALIIGTLSLRNRQAPMLPLDDEHRRRIGDPPCMECHGPDGALPQGENHPLGDDCMRCHGVR
jgi:hypothetical protein